MKKKLQHRRISTILSIGFYALIFCPGSFAYTIDGFIDNLSIIFSYSIERSRLYYRHPYFSNGGPPVVDRNNRTSLNSTYSSAYANRTLNEELSAFSHDTVLLPKGNAPRPLDKTFVYLLAFVGLMLPVARKRYRELKRVLDVVVSAIVLALLMPGMIVIAVLIKLDSPGPLLIRQVRVGLNRRRRTRREADKDRRKSRNLGQLFVMYKFRTMRADAELESGPVWARENDDRITRIGSFLRKTHLDEVPQFVNVLRGDMCIIGPRPERPQFINELNNRIPNYSRRLRVKPGITGLAQVRYRYAASIEDAKKKLKYDLLYARNMCLSMDFSILMNTFNVVISTKGAR